MRATPNATSRLAALLVLSGIAGAGVLGAGAGCGSSDDDSGADGKADATADGSSGHGGDAGGDGGPPISPLDGGSDASDDASDASVTCPASAPADFSDAAVAAACTRFVYLAGGDDTLVIASVDEGATWGAQHFHNIQSTSVDDYVNNLAVYRGVTHAVAYPGVFTSTDPTGGYNDGGAAVGDAGITFAQVTSIVANGFDTYGGELAVNASGVFFTDNEGTYLTRDDETWSRIDGGIGQHWYGSAASPSTYVVFQDSAKFRSYDGTALTDGVLPVTPYGNGNNVAFGNGMFVALGGGQISTSPDAKTWTKAATLAVDAGSNAFNPTTILWDETSSRFLVYENNRVAISTDLKTWTLIAMSASLDTAATSEGHFVATGKLANVEGILLSSDGITWTMSRPFAASETAGRNGWRVGLGRVLK